MLVNDAIMAVSTATSELAREGDRVASLNGGESESDSLPSTVSRTDIVRVAPGRFDCESGQAAAGAARPCHRLLDLWATPRPW